MQEKAELKQIVSSRKYPNGIPLDQGRTCKMQNRPKKCNFNGEKSVIRCKSESKVDGKIAEKFGTNQRMEILNYGNK